MVQLTPLLTPPLPACLQPAGFQRFRSYFTIIAEAMKALQAQAAASRPQPLGTPAAVQTEGCDWTNLDATSAGVLALAGKLCLQLSPVVCSQAGSLAVSQLHI